LWIFERGADLVFTVEVLIYLVAGVAIVALYYRRKKVLDSLDEGAIPELDKTEFLKLRSLLATSYERTLYLGVSFFFLAYASARQNEVKLFAIILVVGIFVYNIFPRHKIMKLLTSSGVDPKSLKERGLRF
jgi:coenzyme F420-reducing hydrogenase beta subunit